MFSWLTNAWRVPELRKRVLFTAMILALYRLGSWMPAPGVDSDADRRTTSTASGGTILGLLNLFSGSALSRFSLFALGIMPYVTASIILQLLTVVIPRLEQLQKEGEAGYAKINQYTRYLTVALAAAQSTGYAFLFKRQGALEANTGPAGADHRHAHRRHDAADVDGRADHEARRRQRHLDPDLRLDPHERSRRHQRLAERRPDGEALLPARRARDRRRGRLHPGGPAPDPDPVREADGRPAHDRRRLDLHAAAREHGRRHPGHLRRRRDGVPADDRPVLPADAGLHQHALHAVERALPAARGVPDRDLHVLLHRGPVQPGRPGRQPAQATAGTSRASARARRPRSTSTAC